MTTTHVPRKDETHENTKHALFNRAFVMSCFRVFVGSVAVVTAACAPAPQTSKTPAAGTEMTRAIVDPYVKIAAALADDSTEGVKANAGNIATAATALGSPAMKIDMAAMQLAGVASAATPDIQDVRDKFGVLSAAIDTYMTGLHLKAPEGVKVAVCPMVEKPWMQADGTIANPYYGKSMQTCGNFR
jgi:Cu(I)/Ag(I) efflux system membrane fusion protein